MAHLVLRSRIWNQPSKWCYQTITTSATTFTKGDPSDLKTVLATPEEAAHRKQLQEHISVEAPVNISSITGIPAEHIKERLVRIFQPAKSAMQSGTDNVGHWQLEFDNRERWENPLMGWCSSGDPHSNLQVQFSTVEQAIEHCEKNGWRWFIQESHTHRPFRPKSYGDNFSWNKRTRVSTK